MGSHEGQHSPKAKRHAAALLCAFALVACATTQTPTAGQGATLDDKLRAASSSDFQSFDPQAAIAAVNALVPLGKDEALAAIEAFLAREAQSNEEHQGLFIVLRVLFDANGNGHPPMRLGGSSPEPPSTPLALPRFPVALIDDVPVMLVSGYMLGGEAEPVSAHVTFYREHGVIRDAPLSPSRTMGDEWAELEMAYRAAYGRAPSGDERAHILAQLERVSR